MAQRRKKHRPGESYKYIASYDKSINDAVKAALKEMADAVAEKAKSICPVRTGQLRDSIHVEVENNGTFYRICSRLKYAPIVEYSPKIDKPFLYPAYDALESKIVERIEQAIREATKKI